jgi:hypothetical protein
MLEVVLGVKLPGIVDRDTSQEESRKVREEARLAVEAYRQGVIASAADHEVPPAEFARLRHKYFGKIPWGPWPSKSGIHPAALGMDEFLLEWPPIGRKYEDLVSLIGAKGDVPRDPGQGGVSYTFDGHGTAYRYSLFLKDGVILSVRKSGF